MTREEAIKELSYIIDDMPSMECADWIEAISMGIKALAQEPCDNAISREAALKCFTLNNTKADVWNNIKALPPVTPAEKVGQWIKTIGENGVTSAVRCSECGFEDNRYMLFKYCPSCGAKMQEEKK